MKSSVVIYLFYLFILWKLKLLPKHFLNNLNHKMTVLQKCDINFAFLLVCAADNNDLKQGYPTRCAEFSQSKKKKKEEAANGKMELFRFLRAFSYF